MAFGFSVHNRFLDLYDSSTVSFKKVNAALLSFGSDSVSDSYSLPVDIPLTPRNNKILGWPGRIDSYNPTLISERCIFYAGPGQGVGIPMFSGRIYVKSAGPDRASVYMVVDGLAVNKEKKFEDVDMGGWDDGGVLDLRSVAKATTILPLDYDFVFFPVYNPTFTQYSDAEKGGQIFSLDYQNFYNFNDDHFLEHSIEFDRVITPFLRLEVAIEKAVTALGYTYEDRFFNGEEELRLLCLYNNRNISQVGLTWPHEIKYNDQVPAKMSIVSFLRSIADTFWCALVVDSYRKTITILPYDDVINQAHRWDWTDKILYDYNVDGDTGMPNQVGYQGDASDGLFSENWSENVILAVTPTVLGDVIGYPGDGVYYTLRDNRTVSVFDGKKETLRQRFDSVATQGKGPEWLSSATPLLQYYNEIFAYLCPQVRMGGSGIFNVDDIRTELTGELANIRLAFYRGMRQVGDEYFIPFASASAYDPTNEAKTFDHSLLYDRTNNIYEMRAARWIYAMQYKKVVKRRVTLRLTDITALKEYDKIKIDGSFYLWREISLSFTSSGMSPAECELWRLPTS